MIERKLSKAQTRVFLALAQQRQELQNLLNEIAGAEREQIELLRQHYSLPEGVYRLRQEPDGSVVLYRVKEQKPPQPEKAPINDDESEGQGNA